MGGGESGPGERTGRKRAQSLLMPRNSPYLSAPPCSPKSSDPWGWGCWSSSLGGGKASCRVSGPKCLGPSGGTQDPVRAPEQD